MIFRHWFSCFSSKQLVVSAFLLLSTGAWAAEKHGPTIFWASDPVDPGQTVQISGADLGEISSVLVTRLNDLSPTAAKFAGSAPPDQERESKAVPATIVAQTNESLSFSMPAEIGSGVFSVQLTPNALSGSSPGAARAPSTTFILNAPDIYWTQGDRGQSATPGGWLRVSGRNIARNGDATLRLTGSDSHRFDIRAEGPDLWSAMFRLPATLPSGEYKAMLFNGNGDMDAWRTAGDVSIIAAASLPAARVDLYPQADGSAQEAANASRDADRINGAMASLAARGGGTLFLHGGIYDLSGMLRIPDGVKLAGEGSDLVTLAWRDSENPPPALIAGVSRFSIENLSITAQRHLDVIRGGFVPAPTRKTGGTVPVTDASTPGNIAVGPAIGSDITLRNLTIRADAFMGHLVKSDADERLAPMLTAIKDGVAGLRLGGRNIVVEGCDLLSSVRPFLISSANGVRITGNTFRSGRRGWYGISGSRSVLFEDNLVIGADLQASGGGINTLEGRYVSRDILIRNNRFSQLYG